VAAALRSSRANQAHQHFAVAGDDKDAALRLGDRQPEPDHCGGTHRPPEVEVPVVVTDRSGIPSG